MSSAFDEGYEYQYHYHTTDIQKSSGKHIGVFAIMRLITFVGFVVSNYIYKYTYDLSIIAMIILIGIVCVIGGVMGLFYIISQSDFLDLSSPTGKINIVSYYLLNYLVGLFSVLIVTTKGGSLNKVAVSVLAIYVLFVLIDLQLFADRLNYISSRSFLDYAKQHYAVFLPMVMTLTGGLTAGAFIADLQLYTKIGYSVVFLMTLINYLVRQCICIYPLSDRNTKIVLTIEYIKYMLVMLIPYGNQLHTYMINLIYLWWIFFIMISLCLRKKMYQ